MKATDSVMVELWKVKDANAKRFGDLAAYTAHLAKLGKTPHAGGAVAAPARRKINKAASA